MTPLQPHSWGCGHHLSALSKRSSSLDTPEDLDTPSPTGVLDF